MVRLLQKRFQVWGLTAVLLLVLGLSGSLPAVARPEGSASAAASVSLQSLPEEARETYRSILSGGPFPHDKDGTVFGNRERQLPQMSRGYYREYTVRTPGASNRGARRIVCGGEPPQRPEVCYYTGDHYASFNRIAP